MQSISVLSYLSYWLLNPKVWIIIGIILIGMEVIDGSFIFFLPIGVGSLINAVILYLQENQIIFEEYILNYWYHTFISLGISSLIISYILQKISKKSTDKDVNDY